LKTEKICTPYAARVCNRIKITIAFQLALTKEMQAKNPHFCAYFLRLFSLFLVKLRGK